MTMRSRKPNIILILMDDTRLDHLSCYGYTKKTTPNLEKICEQSTVYLNNISPSVWTLESMASIVTGTYPSIHNTNWGNLCLNKKLVTVAEFLRSVGYHTCCISNNRAFISWKTGFDRGFDDFCEVRGLFEIRNNNSGVKHFLNSAVAKLAQELRFCEYSARLVNKAAKKRILTYSNRKDPFFLYLHYVEPHFPCNPPLSFDRFIDRKKFRWWSRYLVNQDAARYLSGNIEMTQDDFELLKALYDGEICYLDHKIGELFGFLKRISLLDDTILIITSDHGENFGEHGLMEHRYCLYDTLLRVPLIIRYPEYFKAGLKVQSLVQTLDIFPTIVEMLGSGDGVVEKQFQGLSLLPSALEPKCRNFAVSEYLIPQITQEINPKYDLSEFDRSLRCIRTPKWKFIWSSDGKCELYDLIDDPGETKNVIYEKSSKAKELQEVMTIWDRENSNLKEMDLSKRLAGHELDREITKRLRSLGYL